MNKAGKIIVTIIAVAAAFCIGIFAALHFYSNSHVADKEGMVNSGDPTASIAESRTENTAAESRTEDKADSPAHLALETTDYRLSATDSETYRMTAEAGVFFLSLSDDSRASYAALQTSLEKWNAEQERAAGELLTELKSDYSDTAGEADSDDDGTWFYCSDLSRPYIMRADTTAVSVLDYRTSYRGGPHGSTVYSGLNYDTETGEALALTDIVTDENAFLAALKSGLDRAYSDSTDALTEKDSFFSSLGSIDDLVWTMDSEGVTVCFNTGDLGAYAAGAQQVTLYFDENPSLFQKKYTVVPEGYVIPLADSDVRETAIDVNGDGTREKVSVAAAVPDEADSAGDYGSENRDGTYSEQMNWKVTVGENTLSLDDYSYSADPYLVKQGGAWFLYIIETSDNDYRMLRAVNLADLAEISLDSEGDGTINGGLRTISYDTGDGTDGGYIYAVTTAAFTDPQNVMLESRMDLLSTVEGWRIFRVSGDGTLEADTDWFNISSTVVLRARDDVSVKTVSENGEETGEAVIPSGTYLRIVRSDNVSWADLQEVSASALTTSGTDSYEYYALAEPEGIDADQPIWRVYIDSTDWPRTINGNDIASVFAGTVFAG